jgi:DNA-directed RNA polymerase subunit alpha
MVIEEDHDRDVLKRNALLDTPVTDFELSVRARTCLKKMNIRTLGDLLRITEAELMSYKNFGESSLEEIKKMLSAKGLRLGQGLEDAHRAARRQIMERLKGTGKETLLNKPVGDLQLSVRARKALQLLNIQTLGDLAQPHRGRAHGRQELRRHLAHRGAREADRTRAHAAHPGGRRRAADAELRVRSG